MAWTDKNVKPKTPDTSWYITTPPAGGSWSNQIIATTDLSMIYMMARLPVGILKLLHFQFEIFSKMILLFSQQFHNTLRYTVYAGNVTSGGPIQGAA